MGNGETLYGADFEPAHVIGGEAQLVTSFAASWAHCISGPDGRLSLSVLVLT